LLCTHKKKYTRTHTHTHTHTHTYVHARVRSPEIQKTPKREYLEQNK